MSLPRSFTDEIRARVPLSDVIGKRTKLIRAGREFKACCPFHKEKTPSFTVNDQKGFYHCFGCGAHGDVIGFLMNHDNVSFMDAVEQLASMAGMEVPKATPQERQRFERQMSLYELTEAAAKFYEDQLHKPQNRNILTYLLDRGMSMETIKLFRLGFSSHEDKELALHLKRMGYKDDDLIAAGLFRESQRERGAVYPFFRGRVMFPVQDFQGRVVAFGGRVMPESHGGPPDKSAPKYINSPETAIYHKGRMLYGLSRARKAIGDGETVIVVEGYMDVIALVQAGFRGAVAPLGTALTETQVEEIWKTMPENNRAPVLCFDGDNAGQRAAVRALERILPILKPDYSVRFAFLPPEHDPDSLLKAEGVPAMQRVVENAAGIFDTLWADESRDRNFSQPESKAGFRAALEKRARTITNETVREFFIYEINQKINDVFLSNKSGYGQFSFKKLKNTYKSFGNKQKNADSSYRPPVVKAQPLRTSKLLREKVLIAAMINHPVLFEDFAEEFGMMQVPHPDYEQVRQEIITLLTRSQNEEIYLDAAAVRQHLNAAGHARILDAIFDKSLYLHAGFVRPDQPVADVREGWREAWTRGMQQSRWKGREG